MGLFYVRRSEGEWEGIEACDVGDAVRLFTLHFLVPTAVRHPSTPTLEPKVKLRQGHNYVLDVCEAGGGELAFAFLGPRFTPLTLPPSVLDTLKRFKFSFDISLEWEAV